LKSLRRWNPFPSEPVEELPVTAAEEEPVTAVIEEVPAEAEEVKVPTPVGAIEEPEEEPSLEELFTLRPEVLESVATDEEEESDEFGDKKKKGKKKSKHVEVTYDPDRDTTLVRKEHKRGGGWDWEE